MTKAERDAIATQVAEELFTSGSGAHADRLVLWLDVDERSLGGWSRRAVVTVVRRILVEAELAAVAKDGRR